MNNKNGTIIVTLNQPVKVYEFPDHKIQCFVIYNVENI